MDTQIMNPSTAEERLAFKQFASERLQRAAREMGLCGTADEAIHRAGLVARENWDGYHDGEAGCGSSCHPPQPPVRPHELVGEETAEEFDKWRAAAAGKLVRAARLSGYTPETYGPIFREAGFTDQDLFEMVKVVFEVTARVPMEIEVIKGTDLIDNVTDQHRRAVGQALHRDMREDGDNTVNWKVAVDSA